MSPIHVNAATPLATYGGATAAEGAADRASLLAEPEDGIGAADGSGLMMLLQELELKMTGNNLAAGENRVTSHLGLAKEEIKKQLEAIRKQEEAQSDHGGLLHDLGKAVADVTKDALTGDVSGAWKDLKNDTFDDPQFWRDLASAGGELAKWAAVAGSIALAVGTAGAGAPFALAVIGATLATASAVDSELHVLEKLGVSADAARWADLGMSLGGAACSGGAGIWAAARSGATSTSALASNARIAGTVADVGAGAGAVVGGIGKIGVAYFEAEAKDAEGDLKLAEARQKRIEQIVDTVLDAMRDTYQAGQKVCSDLQKAAQASGSVNSIVMGRA